MTSYATLTAFRGGPTHPRCRLALPINAHCLLPQYFEAAYPTDTPSTVTHRFQRRPHPPQVQVGAAHRPRAVNEVRAQRHATCSVEMETDRGYKQRWCVAMQIRPD